MNTNGLGKLSFRPVLVLLLFLLLSMTIILPAGAQSSSGLGVGQGDGLEVGINLPALQAIEADINAGVYNRPCTEAEHDPTKWHTLVNVEAKCHYDHHHGDDPNYVNDIFGEPGTWFDSPGQSISYPWQTFPASSRSEGNASYQDGRMENQAKHEGYFWVVRRNQSCQQQSGGCITDLRVQFHGVMGAAGAVTRWHSYSMELRVCNNGNDPGSCGIARHGGWTDFGLLFITNSNTCSHGAVEQFIPLPVDNQYMPQKQPESRDQIRCHQTLNTNNLPSITSTHPLAEWWSHQPGRTRFQVRSYDPLSQIDASDPTAWHFYCDVNDTGCQFNQSMHSLWVGYVYHVPEWADYCQVGCLATDRNGDGRTDFAGYTNRFGEINPSCTSAGLDCVPIEYDNIVKNAFNNKEANYVHTICETCQRIDYDLSPAGQTWLTWFFRKYAGVVPTPPQPEPQPDVPEGPAIYFEVDDTTSNQLNVNLRLINVTDVYGIEAQCAVNPQILQGTSLSGIDFSDSNSFVLDEGYQSDGVWHFAASRLAPNPAISGDALAFSLSYNTLADGDGMLDCSAMAVNDNGMPLNLDVLNGTAIVVTPMPPEPVPEEPMPDVETSLIAGQASYQNRTTNAGIIIKLLGINSTVLAEETTGADGAFNFIDIALGNYDLQFSAPQHIPVIESVMLDSTGNQQLQILLRAGDVDDNGAITIDDILLVAANFGLNTVPEISNVDLNADGLINISDLSLTAGNLDLVSPLLNTGS